LTPDLDFPIGGVKIHYQVADALNRSGIHASIVHQRRGFRCTWFENATPVECVANVLVSPQDLIVVPEEWAHHIPAMPSNVPKLIFNQNAYSTFSWGIGSSTIAQIYRRPDVLRVVVVSEDNKAYLNHALPGVTVARMRYAIDPAHFHDRDEKRLSLAYMPRKRRQETVDVLGILGMRNALLGWEITPIDGVSEAQSAELMRRASVFLSFSYREGLGLPPAEAMACGCLVVGFHGYGGRDYGEHALWVPDGDVIGFAKRVEEILRSWKQEGPRYLEMGSTAASYIHHTYNFANRDADVMAAFGNWKPGEGSERSPLPTDCWKDGRPFWQRAVRKVANASRALENYASTWTSKRAQA
jgi:hypothetical protein